jgi:hypothetical protein
VFMSNWNRPPSFSSRLTFRKTLCRSRRSSTWFSASK